MNDYDLAKNYRNDLAQMLEKYLVTILDYESEILLAKRERMTMEYIRDISGMRAHFLTITLANNLRLRIIFKRKIEEHNKKLNKLLRISYDLLPKTINFSDLPKELQYKNYRLFCDVWNTGERNKTRISQYVGVTRRTVYAMLEKLKPIFKNKKSDFIE
jgi:hypothetical protein